MSVTDLCPDTLPDMLAVPATIAPTAAPGQTENEASSAGPVPAGSSADPPLADPASAPPVAEANVLPAPATTVPPSAPSPAEGAQVSADILRRLRLFEQHDLALLWTELLKIGRAHV